MRSRRAVAVAGALLTALAIAACLLAGPAVRHSMARNRALETAKQGHFLQARADLEHVYERDPNDADVARALARGWIAADTLEATIQAQPYIDRWCTLRPDDPEPFRKRMEMWLKLERRAQAIPDGQHVLELVPDDDATRRRLVDLLLNFGRDTEAEKEVQNHLRNHPPDPEWLYYLAASYQHQGRAAEAARVLDPLVAAQPGFPPVLLLRASMYIDAGAPEQAIPLLQRAIELEPKAPKKALYFLAQALTRCGRLHEAGKANAEIQRLQALEEWETNGKPMNSGLMIHLAETSFAAGKQAEAIDLLEKLLRHEPDCASARQLLDSYRSQAHPK
jgi:predicted Zn-dependent protease